MNALPAEIFKSLQKEYVLTFEQKAHDLTKALEEKNLTEIQHICHKLAGSGKTYSFPELSQAAHVTEDYIIKKNTVDKDLKSHIDRIVDLLLQIQKTA